MFKKLGLTFYLDAVACVCALVGFIVAIVSNSVSGQAFESGAAVIAMGALGVVAIAAGTVLALKFGAENIIVTALKLAGLVFIGVAFALIIINRAELASALFSWDPNNEAGWSAFTTSVVADCVFLVSILILIVCSFFAKKN